MLLLLALTGTLASGAASKPKPAWAQSRLTGTWFHVIHQSDYDALGIGDQSFPVGRYKIVVDKIGFFDAYARTAPKTIDCQIER